MYTRGGSEGLYNKSRQLGTSTMAQSPLLVVAKQSSRLVALHDPKATYRGVLSAGILPKAPVSRATCSGRWHCWYGGEEPQAQALCAMLQPPASARLQRQVPPRTVAKMFQTTATLTYLGLPPGKTGPNFSTSLTRYELTQTTWKGYVVRPTIHQLDVVCS